MHATGIQGVDSTQQSGGIRPDPQDLDADGRLDKDPLRVRANDVLR